MKNIAVPKNAILAVSAIILGTVAYTFWNKRKMQKIVDAVPAPTVSAF